MVAFPVHPARKTHGSAGVSVAKFAAGVRAVGVHAGLQPERKKEAGKTHGVRARLANHANSLRQRPLTDPFGL